MVNSGDCDLIAVLFGDQKMVVLDKVPDIGSGKQLDYGRLPHFSKESLAKGQEHLARLKAFLALCKKEGIRVVINRAPKMDHCVQEMIVAGCRG